MRYGSSFSLLKLSTGYSLALGLIGSFALFFWVSRIQQSNEQSFFERRAQFRAMAVQERMTDAINAVQVVNQLFETNGSVSREQFQSFAQPLRTRYPYIDGFAFSRLVSREERPAFEEQMRLRFPGFTISDMVDGRRVVAAAKDRYQVIDYQEPATGNEATFGVDASPQLWADDAIRRADETGMPSVTSLFHRPEYTTAQRGFLVLMPVYKSGAELDDAASRRLAVVGYTVAALRADELVEKILSSKGSYGVEGLDIRVYAAASADESKQIYGQSGTATQNRKDLLPAWLFWNRPAPISHQFNVAGTSWYMVVAALPLSFAAVYGDALLVLSLGLLTTFAATGYLQSIATRSRRVKKLVAKRTDELQQLNDMLNKDIMERGLTEQTLTSSTYLLRQRTRALEEANEKLREREAELAKAQRIAHLGSWNWNAQTDAVVVSEELLKMYGRAVPPCFAEQYETVFCGEAWQQLNAVAQQAIQTGIGFNLELPTLLGSDTPIWIHMRCEVAYSASGKAVGLRGTLQDITRRKQAEAALRDSQTELRKLADHLESAKEEERKRIAREIHDELGQSLMVLRIDMSLMAMRPDSVAVSKERIDAMLDQIDTSIKAVKTIINDLRPAVLNLGLHAAIEWQAKEFERRSGISCELRIDHDEFALDDKRATALFRIVQESLSNIMRHAQASHVQIEMQRREGKLFIKIADDGIGLAPDSRSKENAFGLIGIEERIVSMEGTLSITNNPDRGMTLMLSVPC